MGQYLLSTYAVEGEVPGAPRTPEEIQAFMQRVVALEDEMEASGTLAEDAALTQPPGESTGSTNETSAR